MTAIEVSPDGIVLEAGLVAEKLGLSTEEFWRELQRGVVYGVVERGQGADEGRLRVTFRYRLRSWMVVLDGSLQ